MNNKKYLFSKEYSDIHNDDSRWFICDIEFDELYTEETIIQGYKVKHNGKCKICVYDNEGVIPHFHIENIDKTFSCCIRLDKPEYFSHGEHDDKLTNSDIKKLIKELSKKVDKTSNITNFEYMCIAWNKHKAKTKNKIKEPYKMPDYTKLND